MHWIDCAYVYDGTFAGLLCCVFDSYTRKESPVSISASEQEQTSLYPIHVVQTVPSHAKRITTSLYAKSPKAVNLIKRAFLTCLPDKELCIYQMILQLYRSGAEFLKNPTDPVLYPLYTAIRHMSGELEKLRGFIRFSEFDGIYAAEIEPKNRVLPALRPHFCARFADQPFFIYDRTHKEILLYAGDCWQIRPMDTFEMARPDEKEAHYRRLWKTFFDTIAIRERTNPRCQRTHVPLRYRGTMTEFQEAGCFAASSDAIPSPAPPSSLPGAHQ